MRKETKSSVHALFKYSRKCKQNKRLTVHLTLLYDSTKLKFPNFVSRAYTTSSEFVKELAKRGLHYILSSGQNDQTVLKKCLAMVSQASILKSVTKEYFLSRRRW